MNKFIRRISIIFISSFIILFSLGISAYSEGLNNIEFNTKQNKNSYDIQAKNESNYNLKNVDITAVFPGFLEISSSDGEVEGNTVTWKKDEIKKGGEYNYDFTINNADAIKTLNKEGSKSVLQSIVVIGVAGILILILYIINKKRKNTKLSIVCILIFMIVEFMLIKSINVNAIEDMFLNNKVVQINVDGALIDVDFKATGQAVLSNSETKEFNTCSNEKIKIINKGQETTIEKIIDKIVDEVKCSCIIQKEEKIKNTLKISVVEKNDIKKIVKEEKNKKSINSIGNLNDNFPNGGFGGHSDNSSGTQIKNTEVPKIEFLNKGIQYLNLSTTKNNIDIKGNVTGGNGIKKIEYTYTSYETLNNPKAKYTKTIQGNKSFCINNLPLRVGTNNIKITAYGENGFKGSKTLTIMKNSKTVYCKNNTLYIGKDESKEILGNINASSVKKVNNITQYNFSINSKNPLYKAYENNKLKINNILAINTENSPILNMKVVGIKKEGNNLSLSFVRASLNEILNGNVSMGGDYRINNNNPVAFVMGRKNSEAQRNSFAVIKNNPNKNLEEEFKKDLRITNNQIEINTGKEGITYKNNNLTLKMNINKVISNISMRGEYEEHNGIVYKYLMTEESKNIENISTVGSFNISGENNNLNGASNLYLGSLKMPILNKEIYLCSVGINLESNNSEEIVFGKELSGKNKKTISLAPKAIISFYIDLNGNVQENISYKYSNQINKGFIFIEKEGLSPIIEKNNIQIHLNRENGYVIEEGTKIKNIPVKINKSKSEIKFKNSFTEGIGTEFSLMFEGVSPGNIYLENQLKNEGNNTVESKITDFEYNLGNDENGKNEYISGSLSVKEKGVIIRNFKPKEKVTDSKNQERKHKEESKSKNREVEKNKSKDRDTSKGEETEKTKAKNFDKEKQHSSQVKNQVNNKSKINKENVAEYGEIRGIINNEFTLQPIKDAKIILVNLKNNKVVDNGHTDAAGYFIIKNVLEGHYLIEIQKNGYVGTSGIIDIGENEIMEVNSELIPIYFNFTRKSIK